VGTVSNVLNGEIRVSDSRRGRVLRAVEALGYAPNMLAHGLRRRRMPVVGVCVPQTSIAYFATLADTIEEIASDRGFAIMQVLSRQDPAQELARIKALLRFHVAGMILVPSLRPEAALDLIQRSGTPVVVVDRPAPSGRFDCVTLDNHAAMREATTRLIALGHTRLLFVVRQRLLSITLQRIEAMRAAARAAPRKVDVAVIDCGKDQAALTASLATELRRKRRPTAIIASNGTVASRLLRALRALGLEIPRDVSVLAFDEPEWADLVRPALSVVRQPTREIARTAWECLIRRMNDAAHGVQRIEIKGEVVLRESVAPLRAARARLTSPVNFRSPTPRCR
jgi:LacI family transcriptional regulator